MDGGIVSNSEDRPWARPDTSPGSFEHVWLMATLDTVLVNQTSRELSLPKGAKDDLVNLGWIVSVQGRWKVTPLGHREREAFYRLLSAGERKPLVITDGPQPAEQAPGSPESRP